MHWDANDKLCIVIACIGMQTTSSVKRLLMPLPTNARAGQRHGWKLRRGELGITMSLTDLHWRAHTRSISMLVTVCVSSHHLPVFIYMGGGVGADARARVLTAEPSLLSSKFE